jgi:hypothetical protein
MFDKTKTTSLQDFDSQLDYMIKVGILNRVEDVKNIDDIQTDRFKNLSYKDKQKEIETATDDWWKQYGLDEINTLYTDTIIANENLGGDIERFWLEFLKNNNKKLEKYIGIKKYRDSIMQNKARLKQLGTKKKKHINETLEVYLKENNKKLTDVEIETLSNQLHNRRLNGGCSMWRNVGIEYLYKTHKDELYDFEIEWYEKNFGDIDE